MTVDEDIGALVLPGSIKGKSQDEAPRALRRNEMISPCARTLAALPAAPVAWEAWH